VNAPSQPLILGLVSDFPLRNNHAATSTTGACNPTIPSIAKARQHDRLFPAGRPSTSASAASTAPALIYAHSHIHRRSYLREPERGDHRLRLIDEPHGSHQEEDRVAGHRRRHQVCLRRLFLRYHVHSKFHAQTADLTLPPPVGMILMLPPGPHTLRQFCLP
jgi:hypothetical protein